MVQEYKDGDYIYDTLWLAMKRAVAGNGIFSGLAPSPVSLMTTRLATGVYYASATKMTVAAPVDFVHSAADITYDRLDIIYGDNGTQAKLEGIAAVAPAPPDLPAGAILLYIVRIRAGVTTILTSDIYNFAFESPFFDHKTRHQVGGDDEISVTGLSGLLATDQNPVNHASEHENGGGDEIDVTGLSGIPRYADIVVSNKASDKPDYTTIAAAIAALPASGGRIVLLQGDSHTGGSEYAFSSIVVPAGTELVGVGMPKINIGGVSTIEADNITIEGLDLSTGSGFFRRATGGTLTNFTFKGNKGSYIEFKTFGASLDCIGCSFTENEDTYLDFYVTTGNFNVSGEPFIFSFNTGNCRLIIGGSSGLRVENFHITNNVLTTYLITGSGDLRHFNISNNIIMTTTSSALISPYYFRYSIVSNNKFQLGYSGSQSIIAVSATTCFSVMFCNNQIIASGVTPSFSMAGSRNSIIGNLFLVGGTVSIVTGSSLIADNQSNTAFSITNGGGQTYDNHTI